MRSLVSKMLLIKEIIINKCFSTVLRETEKKTNLKCLLDNVIDFKVKCEYLMMNNYIDDRFQVGK